MAKQLPSRTKYRKVHKGRIRGKAKGADTIAFGEYALQAIGRGRISSNQLEAVRVSFTRYFKRKGKLWFRIFPHKPVTKKPAEVRMGKGKGNVESWVAIVKPGTIICEIAGVTDTQARQAARRADMKLGIRCRFISLEELNQY